MNKALIAKTQSLLKTIKKVLPQVRNKPLAKELMFKALQVIEELKNTKENKDKKDENSGKT
jgi:hypothetical protein